MATLQGSKLKNSYKELLKIDNTTITNDGATATLKAVETGEGTDTALSLSTAQIASSVNGSAGTPAITRSSDPNTGIFFPAADTIAFSEGGTEAMRIDSSGRVGIGATDPAYNLDVRGSNNVYIAARATGSANNTTGFIRADTDKVLFAQTGTSTTPIIFDQAGTERLRIDSNGQVGIGLIPTARNNTRLQIVDGIGFPSTQVASSDANTLDDYEEGTWTMGVSFGGASAGVTYHAGNNTGAYTKIGNQVTVSGYLVLTNKGSSTGDARITGLPFTIKNTNGAYGGIAIGILRNITFADFPHGYGTLNNTTIDLFEATNAGVNTNLASSDFANNSEIIITFTYFV